jgi:S-(hydroxymethyl)glutathione dehydrogenase/alcohol dehydrogenase
MKANVAVLEELNKPLEIREVEIPKLRNGDVLVKIKYAGICGSQVNEITGVTDTSKHIPHLLGHEASGVVKDVGKGVIRFKKGDKVVGTWIKCGGLDDGPKKYGKYSAGSITTFQDYSVISENRLFKINKYTRMKNAALYGCMLPTAIGTVHRYIDRGSNVLVLGAGNIGSACLLALRDLNRYKSLYAIDTNMDRCELAKKLGAYIDIPEDMVFNNIIDTTGNKDLINKYYKRLWKNGKLILIGNCLKQDNLDINIMDTIINSKSIYGSNGGDTNILSIKGIMFRLNLGLIPIKVFKSDNVNEAIEASKTFAGKVVIKYV